MSDLVKQNINFLDKPLWFQHAGSYEKGKVIQWEDIDGYLYRASYKLPDKSDILFLYYMLLKSQQAGYKQKMTFTRYEILTACGVIPNSPSYKRLEDSLKRWLNVTIEFHGTFYDGEEYLSMGFGIIDAYKIRKDNKKVEIRFNKEWLLKIKESGFCKYIQFNYYKALTRPVTRRLFEILCKTFKGRFSWEISLVKLGKKLTLSGRKVKNKDGEEREVIYASDVLREVKPAINEINKMGKTKKILESLNIRPEDAFLLEYEIKGQGNDRVILFKKKSIPGTAKGKTTVYYSVETPESLEEPNQREASTTEKEAIDWLKSLSNFHPDRLAEIQKLDQEEVALIYPYVRKNYESGRLKVGGVYNAFKRKWYLKQAKEETPQEKEEKEKAAKIAEVRRKREEQEMKLWDKVNRWIEHHGGKERALYQGFSIVACNPSVGGLVIQHGTERTSIPLDQVKEKEFNSL